MNANNANNANDGIEPAATVVNEATSLSSSRRTTTAAENAESHDISADKEIVVFFYNIVYQTIPNNVTKLITGKNLTHIKMRACSGFDRLREVDMSASLALKTIGEEAFEGCHALSVVTCAPNVKTIGKGAFRECTKLQAFDLSQAHALEAIGKWAFAKCSALFVVKCAPNVKTIGEYVFYGCTKLQDVDLSEAHALETIGEEAFGYCSALSIIKCAPSLKTIGGGSFRKCTSLQNVDLSEAHALETIGMAAFARCNTLSVVKWAPNLKIIGNGAFQECTKLQDVDLSEANALETIGMAAFAGCSALSVVKWAPNVKTIGESPFLDCTKLQDVMIPWSYHWFVRKLPFDETKLQSVDMQGHDLKKAIRIKNLYPQATPRLSMNRMVSMYARSLLTSAQLENAARNDDSLTEVWAEARVGDLRRLEEIQKAHADSIFKLLHWSAGNGLVENLVVNRKKRKR